MTEIRELIKKRRVELGMSQGQLASELGLAQTFISKIETGERTFPLRAAGDLATALELRTEVVVKAILQSDPTVSTDVISALMQSDTPGRPTRRLVNPKFRRVSQITPRGLVCATGELLVPDDLSSLRTIDLLPDELSTSQVIAYQVKDSSFGEFYRPKTVLLGTTFPTPAVGERILFETKDGRVFCGDFLGQGEKGHNIRLLDSKREKILIPPALSWALFRLKRTEI